MTVSVMIEVTEEQINLVPSLHRVYSLLFFWIKGLASRSGYVETVMCLSLNALVRHLHSICGCNLPVT